MAKETTRSKLRQWEAVMIRPKGSRDVAPIPAAERAGLTETAQLLRSSKNARRLLVALRRTRAG